MPEVFEYGRAVPNASPPQVYEATLSWLRGAGASVKRTQPPVFIEAEHGSIAAAAWGPKGKKTITIQIGGSQQQSQVRVLMSPPSIQGPDVAMRRELTRANWGLFLAGLWTALGDPNAVADAKRAFGSVDWASQRNKGLAMLVGGSAGLVAWVLIEPALAVPNALWTFSNVMVWLGLGGLAAYGAWNAASAVRNAAMYRNP